MKHLLIFCALLIHSAALVIGQNVTFTFSGENLTDGTPLNIDSVYIFNETNSTDTLVVGNTFTTIVTSVDLSKSGNENSILVYPNPFFEEVNISFKSEYSERAEIMIYSLNGSILANWKGEIDIGRNILSFKSNVEGILLLKIISKNIQLNSTLICLKASSESGFELQSSPQNKTFKNTLKSVANPTDRFIYSLKDSLSLSGYSGKTVSKTINDIPSGDKNYTFLFAISQNFPSANFEVSGNTINQGESISFFDLSTNSPITWIWNFGDGDTSHVQNPTHTYYETGNYTVSLIVSNSFGTDTLIEQEFILVNSLEPEADFLASGTSVNQGEAVSFIDQSTNSPSSWNWDFGDGETSNAQNPSHSYSNPGTYTVTLTVENAYGSDSQTKENYISVNSLEPIADFVANYITINQGEEISFTDQSSNMPTSWLWDFGDGETSILQHPMHVYNASGTYTVILIVNNLYGADTLTKIDYVEVLAVSEPVLLVTPLSLEFDTETIQQSLEIKNDGSGSLNWSVSESIEWLTVDPSSGTTTTETDQVIVSVDRKGLPPGYYSGVITLESNGGNKEINVSMEIKEETTQPETPRKPGWQ